MFKIYFHTFIIVIFHHRVIITRNVSFSLLGKPKTLGSNGFARGGKRASPLKSTEKGSRSQRHGRSGGDQSAAEVSRPRRLSQSADQSTGAGRGGRSRRSPQRETKVNPFFSARERIVGKVRGKSADARYGLRGSQDQQQDSGRSADEQRNRFLSEAKGRSSRRGNGKSMGPALIAASYTDSDAPRSVSMELLTDDRFRGHAKVREVVMTELKPLHTSKSLQPTSAPMIVERVRIPRDSDVEMKEVSSQRGSAGKIGSSSFGYSDVGMTGDTSSNSKLLVKNIPQKFSNVNDLKHHFMRFGVVLEVQCNAKRNIAQVLFQTKVSPFVRKGFIQGSKMGETDFAQFEFRCVVVR